MGKLYMLLAFGFASTLLITSEAEECGIQAGVAPCPTGLCCSGSGWCGNTTVHCDPSQGCQGQCWTLPLPSLSVGGDGDVTSIISQFFFDLLLKHRNDGICPARNFYTYDAFITAANAFSGFGTTGDLDTRKREITAFLAQTSHQTTAGLGWASAPDGPYAWGYCFKEQENLTSRYCVHSSQWPCVPGKAYHGRGPMQIAYNYYYGPAGQAIGVDLLSDPDLVATDPVISFKVALWFWMTSQFPKPSCHDVITGAWTPSAVDQADGRLPGYGVIINIINGELECGHLVDSKRMEDRIGFYRTYCDILGVSPGDNIDCYSQLPFGYENQAFLLK